MTALELAVLAGGIAAIAWVNWYFFLAERSAAAAVADGAGVQEVTIAVKGGYSPSTVRVRSGTPLRLVFDRQESSGCSEEVVIPDFGIKRFLPPHEKTVVEFTPQHPGRYEFTCGMAMLRGAIEVE
jgi:plastocyanin domain-containing protein